MAHIEEGKPAQKVPLVYYDRHGERRVVGEATVQLRNGQLQVLGDYYHTPEATEIPELIIEAFSVWRTDVP